MIYIKDMDMPVDCLACRINCEHEHYLEDGRPIDCPLEEAKRGALISRTEAIAIAEEAIHDEHISARASLYMVRAELSALPSADAVSREDYDETDGVIAIEKQSAKDVGEIKHIIIRSPNYTRYFYNESMQLTPAEAVHKPDYSYEADMVRRLKESLSAEAVTRGRLIDADALSEKLCETTIFIKDGEVFQRMINDAPTVSVEAVQGWIPCSERLPDVDVEVLATVDWSDVLIAWLKKDGTWETDEYILANDEILAWMPLPKPYKGGEDE